MHCHSTASQESKLGVQRAVGLPECATPPQEVYELAKRRGMDFVTITDHDTIAGVLEIADRPGRVRLRGADRALPRRAPGRARPLLRDLARGPRVAAGPPRRRRAVRGVHVRARHRLRARAPLLPRRRSADRAPPPAPGAAVRRLGGPQRGARARAEPARRPPTSRRSTAPGSAAPTTTRASTSGAPGPRRPPRARRRVPCARARRRRRRRRRAGQRRQVGARRDRAGRQGARSRAPGASAPDPRR